MTSQPPCIGVAANVEPPRIRLGTPGVAKPPLSRAAGVPNAAAPTPPGVANGRFIIFIADCAVDARLDTESRCVKSGPDLKKPQIEHSARFQASISIQQAQGHLTGS